MADSTSSVPWGRAPDPRIPLPPFADLEAARVFGRRLALHVAALAEPGRLDLATATLLNLLQLAGSGLAADRWLREGRLDATTLRIAVLTYFPAPWTPQGLLAALSDGRPQTVRRRHRGGISWGSDPDYRATPGRDGRWEVRLSERGSDEHVADLSADDLVLLLMSQERSNAFPLGWGTDPVEVAAAEAGAEPVRAAWARHATLPYIRNWEDERRAGRGTGPRAD